MHELGFGELGEVEALEQRELLQPDRAGRPWLRLAHGESSVLVCGGRLESRLPRRHVGAREQAVLLDAEAVDLFGDEALVERKPRALDLFLSRAAAALLDDSPVGGSECSVPEERSGFGGWQIQARWIQATREGAPR